MAKKVIIIYALGWAHVKFGVRIKAVRSKVAPKSKFLAGLAAGRTAEPFNFEIGVPN